MNLQTQLDSTQMRENQANEEKALLASQIELIAQDYQALLVQNEQMTLDQDKWIQEKTRSIRDQTIESLKPEIQNMLTQNRMEMKRMLRDAVMKERQDQSDLYRQKMDQMEEQFEVEKVKACEQERKYVEEQYSRFIEKEKQEVSFNPTQHCSSCQK
jgi:hypothetical protein